MKTASAGLKTFLAANSQFTMVDLYTFTLKNGTTIRRTSFGVDVVLAGNTFVSSNTWLLSRSGYKSQLGTQVDTMTISMSFDTTTAVVFGLSMAQALRRGAFDGAIVQVERCFNGTDTSLGSVILFVGKVAHIDNLDGVSCEMAVDSMLVQLQTALPKNLIQPSCVHTLYDAGCTLSKAGFTSSSTAILAGSTVNKIIISHGAANGYFAQGILKMMNGTNAGFQTSIKDWITGGTAILNRPLPFIPSLGDLVQVTAGCDKTQATCTTKFSNLPNFGGMPYTPKPETAI